MVDLLLSYEQMVVTLMQFTKQGLDGGLEEKRPALKSSWKKVVGQKKTVRDDLGAKYPTAAKRVFDNTRGRDVQMGGVRKRYWGG